MNDETLDFRAVIENKLGIVLHTHQLKRILSDLEIVKNKFNINDKTLLLELNNENKLILNSVIEAITVHESYFFRDQSLFNFLKESYFPQLIHEKKQKKQFKITIWSAGCSRGEEIYSLKILIKELGLDNNPWEIVFYASDINSATLKKAASGIYSKSSLRTLNNFYLNKYFSHKDDKYFLNENIKNNIHFFQHNLSKDGSFNREIDLILCRNVFIYLSQQSIEHAMDIFFQSLSNTGSLFLGSSDFVLFYKHPFFSTIEKGITYYTKTQNEKKSPFEKVDEKKSLPYITRLEKSGFELSEIREMLVSEPKNALSKIDSYLEKNKPTAILYQYKASALLNMNDIDTANEFCDLSIKLDRNNYYVYLMKGVIFFEKNNLTEAKLFFNKALLLKNVCMEAFYYLAQISIFEQSYKNAYELLKKALFFSKQKIENEKDKKLLLFKNESLDKFIVGIEENIEQVKKVFLHD